MGEIKSRTSPVATPGGPAARFTEGGGTGLEARVPAGEEFAIMSA